MSDEEMTLVVAAAYAGVAYSTLAQAAREGRIACRRSGSTWLVTRSAIEEAIREGRLRPRDGEPGGDPGQKEESDDHTEADW